MKCDLDEYAVIIAAAGASQRMGQPKALLQLHDGKTFVEAIVEAYQQLGINSIAIVSSKKLQLKISELFEQGAGCPHIIINNSPYRGRTSSLVLGSKYLGSKNTFIHNVDQPLVDLNLCKAMIKLISVNSYIQCTYEGKRGHPVLLSREIIQTLAVLSNNNLSLRDFLARFKGIELETDNKQILTNINTPDDYKWFLAQT